MFSSFLSSVLRAMKGLRRVGLSFSNFTGGMLQVLQQDAICCCVGRAQPTMGGWWSILFLWGEVGSEQVG